jgi:hypothetical protein
MLDSERLGCEPTFYATASCVSDRALEFGLSISSSTCVHPTQTRGTRSHTSVWWPWLLLRGGGCDSSSLAATYTSAGSVSKTACLELLDKCLDKASCKMVGNEVLGEDVRISGLPPTTGMTTEATGKHRPLTTVHGTMQPPVTRVLCTIRQSHP